MVERVKVVLVLGAVHSHDCGRAIRHGLVDPVGQPRRRAVYVHHQLRVLRLHRGRLRLERLGLRLQLGELSRRSDAGRRALTES